jgi:hypothetical protein
LAQFEQSGAAPWLRYAKARSAPQTLAFDISNWPWPAREWAADLSESLPLFRQFLGQIAEQLRAGGWEPLVQSTSCGARDLLTLTDGCVEHVEEVIELAAWSALAQLWAAWGVTPRHIVGVPCVETAFACVDDDARRLDALLRFAKDPPPGHRPAVDSRDVPIIRFAPWLNEPAQPAELQASSGVDISIGMWWPASLDALAQVYTCGCAVDWREYDRGFRRERLSLPTYPFQRRHCWIDASKARTFSPPLT